MPGAISGSTTRRSVASRLATLGRVVLPLMAPGIASAGLLVFLMSWNELLFAYTFTATEASRTVPVALALFPGVYEVPWGDIAAASMLASLPPILIVAGRARWLVRGPTAGALRGARASPRGPPRRRGASP